MPQKQRKRRRWPGHSGNGCVHRRDMHRNHLWSYDSLTERTEVGRSLKLLVVIDEFTPECLAIEPARSFKATDVIPSCLIPVVLKALTLGQHRRIASFRTRRTLKIVIAATKKSVWNHRRLQERELSYNCRRAPRVILTLQYLFAVRGAPERLRSDNGPEFVTREIQCWLDRASVRTLVDSEGQSLGKRLHGIVQRQAAG